ncbi:MAG: hypothetical protein U0798_11155 [Gemmataceae bacterium]
MKTLVLTLAAAAAFLAAPVAFAGDCPSCGDGGGYAGGPRVWGPKAHKYERFTGWFHSSSKPPKLTAAPWYLYYPYNGQFMTPAPYGAPFVPPPAVGGGMANPYFPGH